MLPRRALAIVNMLIFVVIFTILAGMMLTVISSHTRLRESYVRRTKGYYVAEAGAVAAVDSLLRSVPISNASVEWTFDSGTGQPSTWRSTSGVIREASGISGVDRINSTYNYSVTW